MDDKKISPDLEEDEELVSLRLAALATLKSRASKKIPEPEPPTINNILPINSITRITDFLPDHGSHKMKNSWRNNNQASKRKGKNFPKSSQRSNLIVITPVGAENKNSSVKANVPQLLLPQHKWCHQSNEDSCSPKTDRRTGPSRFNRRGSESESSDSDYSDSDDSYSNETVLQDERSQLSTCNSNTDNADPNNSGVCSELSFQDLDSNLNSNEKVEDLSRHNCHSPNLPKDNSSNNNSEYCVKDEFYSSKLVHNDKHDIDKPLHRINSMLPENSENDTAIRTSKDTKQKSKHTPIKFDLSNKSDSLIPKHISIKDQKDQSPVASYNSKDVITSTDSKCSLAKTSLLSKNDLRFELKRKKANFEKVDSSSRQHNHTDKISPSRDRNRYRSQSKDRSCSRDRKSYRRSRSRERSRTPRRKRSRYSRERFSSSRSSSSSSSSSSSTTTSSDSDRKPNRPVSSVVQPVQSKVVVSDTLNSLKSKISQKPYSLLSDSDHIPVKKAKGIEINLKPVSNIKISIPGNDQRNNVSDVKKRGPVHMRLGTFPRKRIIQMPKDVEAAFVTTSSDEDDINSKCKNSNIMVMKICNKKGDKFLKTNPDKIFLPRSEVPNAGSGNILR